MYTQSSGDHNAFREGSPGAGTAPRPCVVCPHPTRSSHAHPFPQMGDRDSGGAAVTRRHPVCRRQSQDPPGPARPAGLLRLSCPSPGMWMRELEGPGVRPCPWRYRGHSPGGRRRVSPEHVTHRHPTAEPRVTMEARRAWGLGHRGGWQCHPGGSDGKEKQSRCPGRPRRRQGSCAGGDQPRTSTVTCLRLPWARPWHIMAL